MSVCPTRLEGVRTAGVSKMPFPAFWGEIFAWSGRGTKRKLMKQDQV